MIPYKATSCPSGLADLSFPSKDPKDPKVTTSILGASNPLESPAINFKPIEVEVAEPGSDETEEEEKPAEPEGIIQFYEEDIKDYCIGGYHPVRLGDIFNNKYQIVRKLGFGKFSTIWLALDTIQQRPVAIKILKADSHGIEKDVHEQQALRYINSDDPNHLLGLYDHFVHKGPNGNHVCLVFDKLGPDPPRTVLDTE